MKKIAFKVVPKKEESIVSLCKEINKISCRVQMDLKNGFIIAENVDDAVLASMIDWVSQCYTILGVDMDNTLEEDSESVGTVNEHNTESKDKVEEADKLEKETIATKLQSEEELVFQKIECKNAHIEGLINQLLKTVYWAMYKMGASERRVSDFIWTSIKEISMRYNQKEPIAYSVGDVVDCNYGTHLAGEINGGHISAIVCNAANEGMVYLVPFAKAKENLISHSYRIFHVPEDVILENESYIGGTVLLDKGKYVRAERLRSVIGKTTPEFLAKILEQLSSTFDFTGSVASTEDTGNVTPVEKSKKASHKMGTEEAALWDVIGNSLEKLNSTKTAQEQVESFLADIGMETTEKMVTQSFVIACSIKKINYENVITQLHQMFPKVREDIIKSILRENFKAWLNTHPELVESYPKISFISLLKVFAKRLARG